MVVDRFEADLIGALKPGQYVVGLTDSPQGAIRGRRLGLEVRDTLLVVSMRGPMFAFLCRKPVEQTVAENVLRYGVGGLNIDGCRVRHSSAADLERHKAGVEAIKARGGQMANSWKNSSDLSGANEVTTAGRWPTNLVLIHGSDCRREGNGTETVAAWVCQYGCPVASLDQQSVERGIHSAGGCRVGQGIMTGRNQSMFAGDHEGNGSRYGDSGGASRFFPQFAGNAELLDWLGQLIGPHL